MKKIINGVLYNDETARCIGTFYNGYDCRNFNFYQESLCQTKSGRYFLYGFGGGNSKYAVWHGNSGGGGEELITFSPEEARDWAEEYLTADEYIAEFGEPEEVDDETDDNKVPVKISMVPATHTKLRAVSDETGKSMSSIIDELISKI